MLILAPQCKHLDAVDTEVMAVACSGREKPLKIVGEESLTVYDITPSFIISIKNNANTKTGSSSSSNSSMC